MSVRTLVVVVMACLIANSASAGDEKARARLLELQTRVVKQEFAGDKLRREVLAFARDHVGTPLYAKAIDALRACPAPLDRLDANAIDAEERKFLSIPGLVAYVRPHGRAIASAAISFDGEFLATSGWDNTVHVFKLGGKEPKSWAKLEASPSGIAFSPDGRRLATGASDTHTIVWDLTGPQPKQEHKLSGHKQRPFALAFAPRGHTLVSGSFDPILRVWKLDDLTPEAWAELEGDDTTLHGIASLAFSHDAKLLIAGSHLGKESLHAWTIGANNLQAKKLPAAQARVVACSPADATIAFAGDDGTIHLWNLGGAQVEKIRKIDAHTGKALPPIVKALAFSPDGKILASSGQDKRVRVWTVATGEKLREWHLLDEARALAFSSDGRHLAVGNSDGTLYLLRLEASKIKLD